MPAPTYAEPEARARAELVRRYCNRRGGTVLAELREYVEDFLSFALPPVVLVDPLVDVDNGAFAWVDGDGSTGTTHAVVIDEVEEEGAVLRLSGLHGCDEFREITLYPLATAGQRDLAARLRVEQATGDLARFLRDAAIAATDDARRSREARVRSMRRFAVTGVARQDHNRGGDLVTAGAFAVDEDGPDWSIATLPEWSHLCADFNERVRRATSAGHTPLELMEYLVDHANGITVDYSVIEHVTMPTARAAAHDFLSRYLADWAPHLVRRRARPFRSGRP